VAEGFLPRATDTSSWVSLNVGWIRCEGGLPETLAGSRRWRRVFSHGLHTPVCEFPSRLDGDEVKEDRRRPLQAPGGGGGFSPTGYRYQLVGFPPTFYFCKGGLPETFAGSRRWRRVFSHGLRTPARRGFPSRLDGNDVMENYRKPLQVPGGGGGFSPTGYRYQLVGFPSNFLFYFLLFYFFWIGAFERLRDDDGGQCAMRKCGVVLRLAY
jgi:hypothetical protein